MRSLEKHLLCFKKTIEYFNDQLINGNTLSLELIKLVDFSEGNFFTLLPSDADIEKCYEFTSGGILPQLPKEWYSLGKEKASFSLIPTIQEEISEYILQKAIETDLSCIFEEVLSSRKSQNLDFFKENSALRFYQDEVYFIVNKTKLNRLLISKCLEKSNAIWRSLCILSKFDLNTSKGENLNIKEMDNICINNELIILGAYDGEGYVFWKKNS